MSIPKTACARGRPVANKDLTKRLKKLRYRLVSGSPGSDEREDMAETLLEVQNRLNAQDDEIVQLKMQGHSK